MTTTTDIVESTTDLTGFPRKFCTRCGGCGEYSWCQAYGTTCFQCMIPGKPGPGSGFAIATKAATEAGQYAEAMRRAKSPIAQDLRAGDRVWVADGFVRYNKCRGEGAGWVEITEVVRHTDQVCGWQVIDGEKIPTAWTVTITFASGVTDDLGGNTVVRRFVDGATIDRVAYVERAWETVPVKVQKARKLVLFLMGQAR